MTTNDTPQSERSLLDGLLYYLAILFKYRVLIVLITLTAGLASTGFVVFSIMTPPEESPLPNIYTADATIIIQKNEQTDIGETILQSMGIGQGNGYRGSQDIGALIIKILQSRTILDQLITKYDIIDQKQITKNPKTNSRAYILSKMWFNYQITTGLFKIYFEDIDPVFAADIINSAISLLDEWFRSNTGIAKQKQKKLLEDKIAEVKIDIEKYQTRLKALQKKYGVLTVQDLGASQASSIANLRSQLILKEIEIKNYTSFSKIDDPRLEQLKEERQNLVDLISQNQGNIFKSFESTGSLNSIPDVAQEFSQLTIELDIQQRIYNTLSPQLEAAKLTTETAPAFQVLELAEVPDMKSGPKRVELILMATAGGFVFGIGLAILINLIITLKRNVASKTHKDTSRISR